MKFQFLLAGVLASLFTMTSIGVCHGGFGGGSFGAVREVFRAADLTVRASVGVDFFNSRFDTGSDSLILIHTILTPTVRISRIL
jgi:hypothetical protein